MKLHPLHTVEFVAQCLQATGEYPGDRATGRSTSQALGYISSAIRNPDKPIRLIDHWGTTGAHDCLADMVVDIISKLGLRGLYVERNQRVFIDGAQVLHSTLTLKHKE